SQIAAFLRRAGAQKGDRALIIGENGFFWVAAYLGVMREGLVSIPLPARVPASDLANIVAKTTPRFSFVESRALAVLAPELRETTTVCDYPVSGLKLSSITMDEIRRHAVDGDEPIDMA